MNLKSKHLLVYFMLTSLKVLFFEPSHTPENYMLIAEGNSSGFFYKVQLLN